METYEEFIQNILETRGRFSCGDEYHERHHITPKCMGGSNAEENLIDLYAKEHFIAHKLLVYENPDNDRLIYAWTMMAWVKREDMGRYELTPEEYEEVKIVFSKLQKNKEVSNETRKKISESAKLRIGNKNPFYGKHHTKESKEKIREIRFKNPKKLYHNPQEALSLFNDGMIVNEIAAKLRVNRNTVSDYLKKTGLMAQEIRTHSETILKQRAYDEKVKLVLELWNYTMMTQTEIQKHTHIGLKTIRDILDENGIDEHARRSRAATLNNKNRLGGDHIND